MRALSRTIILAATFLIVGSALLDIAPAISAEKKPPAQVLFTNVNIFDGFSDQLQNGMSVLVEDNHIKQVGKDLKAHAEATVIDGAGRTMTPGLIDMHSHIVFMTPEGTNSYQDEWDAAGGGAMAAQAIRDDYLMKGVTTIRDIAGNSRGIARASQRGLLIAPRIYTAGGVLSHTGGHGDWGDRNDIRVSD